VLWVDFVIPAGDPLWDDDVSRAAWWVGDAWAEALEATGIAGGEVWRGPMRRSAHSSLVCFSGMGPGEVGVGGRKVVGIAQRRTRHAALFQTAALLEWDPGATLDLLRLPTAERSRAAELLAPACLGVGSGRRGPLEAALLRAVGY
jgi:lipoate-protein ligase A